MKENIKALRHWPLCGEFTGDRWIPRTNDQWRGKCFHLMTSSCYSCSIFFRYTSRYGNCTKHIVRNHQCSKQPIGIKAASVNKCSLGNHLPFQYQLQNGYIKYMAYWIIDFYRESAFNSSWPSATYMRLDFQCLFPQHPRYLALISVLISPVPHTWGVTNGSLLASPPNSRRSPASLISPAPHICGASRTPILARVVWKILNVVTNILVVLPDYTSCVWPRMLSVYDLVCGCVCVLFIVFACFIYFTVGQ